VVRTWPDAEHVVRQVSRLDTADVAEIVALTHAAGDADGAYPLSEHVMLHLRHGGDTPATHILAYSDGHLVGYAHVDPTDAVEGPSAELCVHPLFRRKGLGRALVMAAMAAAAEHDPSQRLRLWAHGDHPSANALALSLGFARTRVLWQMRRSLFAPVDAPTLPEGVVLREFQPGADDAAWLAVNSRAFADHPDQGKWTIDDLHIRLAESWFDPAGFLLAVRGVTAKREERAEARLSREREERAEARLSREREERAPASPAVASKLDAVVSKLDAVASSRDTVLGFHWTKVHGARSVDPVDTVDDHDHDHDPIGEVYVLGVDPAAQGLGLGVALTLAGLRYLRGRGLDQVMLYVDETNRPAVALYQRLGFARWSTDVCFRRTA
jgi:mycothiol synthase